VRGVERLEVDVELLFSLFVPPHADDAAVRRQHP